MISFNKIYFPKKKFILAVSGGIDSLAICHFLKEKKFDFLPIHINHNFIKQDIDIAKGVEKFFKENSIPYYILDVKKNYESGSKEDFCRKVRYESLLDFAQKSKIDYICTGHHLDDCVESYFLNFLKGCPEYVPIHFYCKYAEATIFRPFLLNKKVDFIEYMAYNNLTKFVIEDELNTDTSLMRNWVRHDILPVIEKKYKGLHKVVFKKMKLHLEDVVKHI
jgi:tRNA(Ile)-lysidine synthetase-like protein